MSIHDFMKNAESVDLFSDMPEKTKKEIDLKGKIAAAILNKRSELHMNQTQLGELLGISQGMVSKWENGEVNFTVDAFEEICRKLGLEYTFEIKSSGAHSFARSGLVNVDWKKFSSPTISFCTCGESKNAPAYI